VNTHIIFVFPPAASVSDENIAAHFNMCLGSAYIISYLVQNGFIARPFLTTVPFNVSRCAARILAGNPRVVGFTVFDANYYLCQLIADALKRANPHIIILFGGPTASVQAEVILRNNACVDICVRNEGEETCLELLSKLDGVNFDLKRAAACFEEIKGISYRLGDQILENPGRNVLWAGRKIPGFLDKYPSPYLSGVLDSSRVGIITARGCNQHCVYCNCAAISKRMILTHSIDRVMGELDYISKQFDHIYGNNLVIYDDAFTLMPDRALEICRKIIENKIKVPLVCMTRCDLVNEELLDTMKEAGFKSIGFSLESAVPHILRKIGKVQHPDTKADANFEKEKEFIGKFKKYTYYAKKIGIKYIFASVMVGLPGETPGEGQQTVDYIGSLEDMLDYYSFNDLSIYPGTPLFHNHEKYGIKLLKDANQVHYQTIHAYDTGKIQLTPKANFEIDNIRLDKANMKLLALSASKKSDFSYFNNIILCADIITEELVCWLQKYLAVNGPLIQIYSNLEGAKQYHRDNGRALRKYMSPSRFHMGYYQTLKEDGVITLTPFRRHVRGRPGGITIDWLDTASGISCLPAGLNPLNCICIDRKKEDTFQLYHLLIRLSRQDKPVKELAYHSIYPYFSSLCRWGKFPANCRTLETVIVDADYHVKTCWYGDPVGKVGMPFPGLVENIGDTRQTTRQRRGCQDCIKQSVCLECMFPGPLAEDEYCDLKRDFNTEAAAELMRTFDFFKEL